MRSYQREWDDVKRVFRKTPLHNWASHASDSFRYAAMAYRNIKPEKKKPDLQETLLQQSTLDEMWNIHDKERNNLLEPRI